MKTPVQDLPSFFDMQQLIVVSAFDDEEYQPHIHHLHVATADRKFLWIIPTKWTLASPITHPRVIPRGLVGRIITGDPHILIRRDKDGRIVHMSFDSRRIDEHRRVMWGGKARTRVGQSAFGIDLRDKKAFDHMIDQIVRCTEGYCCSTVNPRGDVSA